MGSSTIGSNDFFGTLQNNLNAFSPKNLDIDTADARMEHTGINVKSINIKNTKTNETSSIELDGVFVAIGHDPATQIFRDQVEMDEDGYIITNAHNIRDSFKQPTVITTDIKVRVVIPGGEAYDAEIVGLDTVTDIA